MIKSVFYCSTLLKVLTLKKLRKKVTWFSAVNGWRKIQRNTQVKEEWLWNCTQDPC